MDWNGIRVGMEVAVELQCMATMHGSPYGPGTLRNQVGQDGVK